MCPEGGKTYDEYNHSLVEYQIVKKEQRAARRGSATLPAPVVWTIAGKMAAMSVPGMAAKALRLLE